LGVQDSNTVYKSIPFILFNKKMIIALIWSTVKGDWWYDGDDCEKRKRFFWTKIKSNDTMKRYCMYIGRLAFSYMVENKNKQ
jgi:hypothetical protein